MMLEAAVYMGWARYRMLHTPFAVIAASLGSAMQQSSFSGEELPRSELVRIHYAINIMSKYTLWESKCLVRALAGMKMLERRGIESTLYLGTAKNEEGKLIAHAWLRSGPWYITGAEEMARFTVTGTFARLNTEHRKVMVL
ncbi:lasso peptide biosynthesis B2 protein [Paenibacillus sp. PL2-23]|uniref:lasso peptide biosynthesis B2 protein n=1 Tax=Paenibacillus sp. PL2-23 TaxID=2100729 RepID=UPI0030F7F849